MRKVLVAFAFLMSVSAFPVDAFACRPQFQSTAEIVERSTSIFMVRVVATDDQTGLIELRVIEVLKGSVPETLRVNGKELFRPDLCSVVNGGPERQAIVGGQYLISGNIDSTGNIALPDAGADLYVFGPQLAVEVLNDYRQEILRSSKRARGALK